MYIYKYMYIYIYTYLQRYYVHQCHVWRLMAPMKRHQVGLEKSSEFKGNPEQPGAVQPLEHPWRRCRESSKLST